MLKPHPHSNQRCDPKTKNDSGEVVTDKTKTVCRHCKKMLTYTNSTTDMIQHINVTTVKSPQPSVSKKLLIDQSTLTGGFATPLASPSPRAAEITRCNGVFMAKDMRPFFVIENEGFWLPEPRYTITPPL